MSQDKPSPDDARMLMNDLSVGDARHLIQTEGGELTLSDVALQLASTAIVAALTARALSWGNATVWHLALPMFAQYLALMAALPPTYLVVRHPGLRKDAVGALRLWFLFALVLAITVAVRSHQSQQAWQRQLAGDTSAVWRWIADAQMHWPMLAAAVSTLAELPGRVRNLFVYGPPFVGVGLGCAMRLVVILLFCAALPWAFGASTRMAWFLWFVIILSDLLALWMHLDIQHKLRKVERDASS
jgi:hypothetical protein